MPAFKEVLDDLYDLLNANAAFKGRVSRHDFSAISNEGSTSAVLRVGGFTSEDDSFAGNYAVVWDIFVDIYVPYQRHVEEDVDTLIKARDTLVDLIQIKTYLGKGSGNADGITAANIIRGEPLAVIVDEDTKTVSHITLSMLVKVTQARSVTLET